jgi:hypothetical protein
VAHAWHGACTPRVVEIVSEHVPSVGTRERRAHRRVKLVARAALDDGAVESDASCLDLSMGGSCLRASGYPIGKTVRIGIELEPGVWVHTDAEIVRASEDFIGVRFVQLPQRALTAILGRVAQG